MKSDTCFTCELPNQRLARAEATDTIDDAEDFCSLIYPEDYRLQKATLVSFHVLPKSQLFWNVSLIALISFMSVIYLLMFRNNHIIYFYYFFQLYVTV